MEGGVGKNSYHCNSALQAQGFRNIENVIKEVLRDNLFVFALSKVIRIADLGCANGANTIQAMDFVANEVIELLSSQGHVEVVASFSDVVLNDFNTLFALLPHLQGRPYFFSAVPGSFFGRLFPRASIHLAMTSFALHYLSKLPEAITDKASAAWNGGRMFVNGSSPPAAIMAVAHQAKEDLHCFLENRAHEMVAGGILIMMFPVRLTQDLPVSEFAFQSAWKDLIQEGLLSQESLDTFNYPSYVRSPDEVHEAVSSAQQHFKVIREKMLKFPSPDSSAANYSINAMKVWKVVSKRFLEQHIGDLALVELMYERMVPKVTKTAIDLDIILLVLQRLGG